MITITIDSKRLTQALSDIEKKHVPFAIARALTDVAQAARADVLKNMPSKFDRPTSFTMRSIAYDKAAKSSLAATVKVLPIQAKYLLHEEVGGTRTPGENTRKPAQALLVPGHIKLDAFGNIPSGSIARIKRMLERKLQREHERRVAVRRSMGKRERKRPPVPNRDKGVFYVPRSNSRLAGGFWARLPGHRIQHLLGFVSEAHYHPRLGFQKTVRATYERVFDEAFTKRLQEALTSSR